MRLALLTLAICLSAGLVAGQGQASPPAQQTTQAPAQTPVFKGRLDVLRAEVSVIDNRTGRPVTGLQQSDFSVFENGTRQEIANFLALNPGGTVAGVEPPPGTRRVFLIVFGAGYLAGPINPYDGAIEFLRKRLDPDDLAAVMVWNKVTALTTDHERLAAVVDRVRRLPEEVFDSVKRDIFKLIDMSPETQTAIETWLNPSEGSDDFLRSAATLIIGTNQYRQEANDGWAWNRRIAGSDLLKVYAGIEYLRRVEGQRHLVLLSRSGLHSGMWRADPTGSLRSTEDDHRLAVRANDAGVALDIIHTLGTPPGGLPGVQSDSGFDRLASEQTARESGGQFTSVRTAAEGLTRLDAATRSGYLIGYVPNNPNLDSKYRSVEIRVNRKDVTVVYRRGYTARAEAPPIDPRELMARIRLREGAESSVMTSLKVDDIKLAATATAVGTAGARQVRVDVTIDPSGLTLAWADGRWTGRIDLMILCTDLKARIVGSLDQRMDLNMSPALYDRAKTSGIPYSATVPVAGAPTRVKVIVYNYDSDRLGVEIVAIK